MTFGLGARAVNRRRAGPEGEAARRPERLLPQGVKQRQSAALGVATLFPGKDETAPEIDSPAGQG